MLAEIGLLFSTILVVLGFSLALLGTVKATGAALALLGAVTLALQLWIYYKRWHDY